MKQILFAATLCMSFFTVFPQSNTKSSNLSTMKEFSFIVGVPVTYSPEQVQKANVIWAQRLEQWKSEGIYIVSFPFPAEGYVVSGKDKTTKKESVLSNNTRVVSTIFLKAEDFEKALELAKTFPVLEYDGTVEVREILRPAPVK